MGTSPTARTPLCMVFAHIKRPAGIHSGFAISQQDPDYNWYCHHWTLSDHAHCHLEFEKAQVSGWTASGLFFSGNLLPKFSGNRDALRSCPSFTPEFHGKCVSISNHYIHQASAIPFEKRTVPWPPSSSSILVIIVSLKKTCNGCVTTP